MQFFNYCCFDEPCIGIIDDRDRIATTDWKDSVGGGNAVSSEKPDDANEPQRPLNYASSRSPDELNSAKKWDREHRAELRRVMIETYWMDITTNWKMWIVAIFLMVLFYGCMGFLRYSLW